MTYAELPIAVYTLKLTMPRLEFYYPAVSGLPNINVQKKINDVILDEVYRFIREQGYYGDNHVEITGYYEIKTNERGILCRGVIGYHRGAD